MTTQVHYRRTKQGEWVVCGPTRDVRPGIIVTVTKRDGTTKKERVLTTGRPFTVDGVELVYGYLDRPLRVQPERTRRSRRYCCDECGEWVTEGDGSHCWETGFDH